MCYLTSVKKMELYQVHVPTLQLYWRPQHKNSASEKFDIYPLIIRLLHHDSIIVYSARVGNTYLLPSRTEKRACLYFEPDTSTLWYVIYHLNFLQY